MGGPQIDCSTTFYSSKITIYNISVSKSTLDKLQKIYFDKIRELVLKVLKCVANLFLSRFTRFFRQQMSAFYPFRGEGRPKQKLSVFFTVFLVQGLP